MRNLSRRFKALSEEHRLRIVAHLLRHGEACVCEVEHFLGVSQSTASRHLRYLAGEHLVEDRREGPWVFYHLTDPLDAEHARLLETLRLLLEQAEVADAAEVQAFRAERCIETSGADEAPEAAAVQVAR